MKFNSLIRSHFKGCPQIGEVGEAPGGRTIKVFKLPESDEVTSKELVGAYDGVDSWVCSTKHSLFGMKKVNQEVRTRRRIEV